MQLGFMMLTKDYINKMHRLHFVKSVKIRSYFWSVFSPNTRKYGPEITPYLGTFHAEMSLVNAKKSEVYCGFVNIYTKSIKLKTSFSMH